MKLMIKESEDTRIFIDLIRGMNPDDLQEDIIPADEPLKQGKDYNDPVDTRKNLSVFLTPLAARIRRLHCVEKVEQYYPENPNNEGLSNYIRITFKHPYGISDDEIYDYYFYTIRFSDHGHEEARDDYDIIDSQEVIGQKPKDLTDIGWKIFEDNLDWIESEIKQHEIDTYGFQKTTLQ